MELLHLKPCTFDRYGIGYKWNILASQLTCHIVSGCLWMNQVRAHIYGLPGPGGFLWWEIVIFASLVRNRKRLTPPFGLRVRYCRGRKGPVDVEVGCVCHWGPSEALSGCSGQRHFHPQGSLPALNGGSVVWATGSAFGATQPRFCIFPPSSAAMPPIAACALDLIREAPAYRVKVK